MQNSGELLDAFRSDIIDEAQPYLWSDAEVIRYMDAAYRMFVRLTGGIADISSDATAVDMIAGERLSDLHPSILRIMSACKRSDSSYLDILNAGEGSEKIPTSDYRIALISWRQNLSGPVTKMIHGMERGKVAWVKTPEFDDTVDLHIYRLPLERIVDRSNTLSDVDEDHHIYLIDWMKHLAYKKQDAETFDKSKSDECEAQFRAYCEQCKREWERYKHKNRVVQYAD